MRQQGTQQSQVFSGFPPSTVGIDTNFVVEFEGTTGAATNRTRGTNRVANTFSMEQTAGLGMTDWNTSHTPMPRRQPTAIRDTLTGLQTKSRQQAQEELEARWLAQNRHRYAGEWIAIHGDTLIAHSRTAKEVFQAAKDAGSNPLIMQVESEDMPFAGW